MLFERGAFGPTEAAATAAALVAYAAGLPAFVLVKVLAPGVFRAPQHHDAGQGRGRRDGRSTSLLTVVLMQVLAHVGVAIALSASGWMQALTLLVAAGAARPFPARPRGRAATCRASSRRRSAWPRSCWRCALVLAPALAGPTPLRLAALAGLVAAGLVAFAALVLALGVTDWRELARPVAPPTGLTGSRRGDNSRPAIRGP